MYAGRVGRWPYTQLCACDAFHLGVASRRDCEIAVALDLAVAMSSVSGALSAAVANCSSPLALLAVVCRVSHGWFCHLTVVLRYHAEELLPVLEQFHRW